MPTVNASVRFRVPAWNYCNLMDAKPSSRNITDRCRFCTKTTHGYTCVLFNDVLSTRGDGLIEKTKNCRKLTAGVEMSIGGD